MKNSIVWAAGALVAYEVFAIKTHRCETWTDACAHHSKKSAIVWGFIGWLITHLLTGGKV